MRARLAASGEADDAQRRRWGRVVTDWVANEKTTTIYIKTYPRGEGRGCGFRLDLSREAGDIYMEE